MFLVILILVLITARPSKVSPKNSNVGSIPQLIHFISPEWTNKNRMVDVRYLILTFISGRGLNALLINFDIAFSNILPMKRA